MLKNSFWSKVAHVSISFVWFHSKGSYTALKDLERLRKRGTLKKYGDLPRSAFRGGIPRKGWQKRLRPAEVRDTR